MNYGFAECRVLNDERWRGAGRPSSWWKRRECGSDSALDARASVPGFLGGHSVGTLGNSAGMQPSTESWTLKIHMKGVLFSRQT